CRRHGREGWDRINKKAMQEAIGDGSWRTKYTREEVLAYCEEDVRMSTDLLRDQLRGDKSKRLLPVDTEKVIHWSDYSAKAVARIQAKGIPIDTHLWNLTQENKQVVISHLLRTFDPSYGTDTPVYDSAGSWSDMRFVQYLVNIGVTAWPLHEETGRPKLDKETLETMYHIPGIENLHALRDVVGFINKMKLPIGRDGRNRPSLHPFCTATGRNAHSKSSFNAHAGLRSFILFDEGMHGSYRDFEAQEMAVA